MENEETKVEEMQPSSTEENYIETIKNLKRNTVSKELYDELAQQNKELLNAYINENQPIEQEKEDVIDTSNLIKEIKNNENLTNLDFIKKVVTLRNAKIKEGKGDIFVPLGRNYTPTDNDYSTAEKVASVFEECIKVADGDPDTFTFELQKRMAESPLRR